MRGKKLESEVSVQEMQHLRDEGLCNRDIAERLDICERTVYRYIGKNPKGMRGKPRTKPIEDVIVPKNTLQMELQVTSYVGKLCRYKITNMGTLEIVNGPVNMRKGELNTFIVELMEIYSQM